MMMILFSLLFMFILNLNVKKKFLMLFYSIYLFILMFMLILFFNYSNLNFWMNLYMFMGMDYYSYGLILLTFWIMLMVFMFSGSISNMLYFYNLVNLLMMILVSCFFFTDLLLFYLMFEFSLIPLFLIIMGWGYQIDRIEAGFYMFMYTIFGSLPLLFMIIYNYINMKIMFFDLLEFNLFNFLGMMMVMMAFLIKMPMYFIHMWLPKAHLEAPVVGSMILAGIMLKLGGYGLLRLLNMINSSLIYLDLLIMFSLVGGLISSLMCIYQVDMKLMVAYSSVVHMNFLISSIYLEMSWSFMGSFLMMLSHGLSSSGLFSLVGLIYSRTATRSLIINKGLINIFSSMSLMWFIICSSSISFPFSMNFFSEFLMLNSLIIYNKNLFFILIFYLFLSAFYIIYLYSFSQHGKFMFFFSMMNFNLNEYYLILFHWLPLNIFFLKIYLFI